MNDVDMDRLAEEVASRLAEKLDDRPLLRMTAAAERLSVSRRTLYSMVERGDIAVVKVAGGSQRVEQREIDRYIAARREPEHSGGK